MALFKAVVRRPRKDGFWHVYIRVTVGRRVGYVKTDKMVTGRQLTSQGEITDAYVLRHCSSLIIKYNERLVREDTSRWTLRQVMDFLRTGDGDLCFSDYARAFAGRLLDEGRDSSAGIYETSLRSLERFLGTGRVMFRDLTSRVVARWVESLSGTRRAKESYPTYMRRVFRAAAAEYNDYDNDVIRVKGDPWARTRIPRAETPRKRAAAAERLREFFSASLPADCGRVMAMARDVAKMSLCLGGMNAADLFSLRKCEFRGGRICYRRRKTRSKRRDEAYIEMRVEPIVTPLIERWAAPADDPFLFRFHSMYASTQSFCGGVNAGLRGICASMGMPMAERFTTYTFRHTWATVAQNDCGASLSEVAFAMNHSSGLSVTRGYVKIDFSPAWELNRKVIDFIFFSAERSKLSLASGDAGKEEVFSVSPGHMVYARAYLRGEVMAEVSDIGFRDSAEVIARLAVRLPSSIPDRSAVQFRLRDVDTGLEIVHERVKGRDF